MTHFTEPILNSLRKLPISKLFLNRVCITMFKIHYDLLPTAITSLFSKNKDIHFHNTQNKNYKFRRKQKT